MEILLLILAILCFALFIGNRLANMGNRMNGIYHKEAIKEAKRRSKCEAPTDQLTGRQPTIVNED